MKAKLFLFLALLTQTLSFAQTTGRAWESIRWDKGDSVIYGRVLREYALFPGGSGDAAFYDAINKGTLQIQKRVGPSWLSSRVTYLESAQSLQVDAAASTSNIQLKIERVDGQGLTLGNADNPSLSGGVFYGYGSNPNQGSFDKQWVFGKAANGTGGVPAVPIRLTFKNADSNEQFPHVFTPTNRASRATLFVAAGSSPPVSAPSWVSARYSYNSGTNYLTIEAEGDGMQVMFERADGQGLTGGNSDGINTLVSGTYYPNGPLTGQGSFDKQWQFGKRADGSGGIPSVPIRVSFKRNSDNATFGFVFTPVSATRQTLFTAGGSGGSGSGSCNFTIAANNQSVQCGSPVSLNVSASGSDASGLTYAWTGNGINQVGQTAYFTPPGANGTYTYTVTASKAGCANKTATATVTVSGCGSAPLAYNRVLFIGNSILYHPAVPSLGWYNNNGMAASGPTKDFFYLTQSYLRTLNPNVDCRKWGNFPGTSEAEGGYWEANYWQLDGGLSRYNAIADWKPDLIILRLSENIVDTSHDLFGNLGQLIDKLKSQNPACQVIVTNSVWGQVVQSNTMQQFAVSRSYPFVDLFDMWTADPGNQGQPASNNPYYARSTGQYADAGVAKHPSDAGMALIANRIIAKIPGGTVTPPSNGNGGGTYFSNGYGEGTVAQLMASAPFIPSNNQIDNWNYASQPIQYLDNGIIRFGIGRSIGGEIQHLGLSNGGKNWINTYKESGSRFQGLKAPDTGRAGGWSLYGTPGHFYRENGQNTGDITIGDDTGWNPVQGGSRFQNRSEITWYEKRNVAGYGDVLYTKTRPFQWSMDNIAANLDIHCYWWLEGNNVRYFSIIDNYRNDNQRIYHGSQQEGPFIYTTGDLWHHKLYNGNNPGTGGGLTDISRNAPGLDSKLPVATEPWIASLNGQDNGVILLSQHNPRMMGGQFNEFDGDEFSLAASYINSAQMMNMDVNVATAFGGYIWAGSLSGFRNWYNNNQYQVAFRPFSFNFVSGVTCGWWTSDTEAKFNSENRYEFTFGNSQGGGGNFNPPYGIYKASDIPTLYIKGKFSGISQIDIRWNRNDQDDNQSNAAEQVTTLNVIGDGQERTYSVQMAGKNGWNNYIGSMRIGPHLGSSVSTNQKFVPTYIGKNNPN